MPGRTSGASLALLAMRDPRTGDGIALGAGRISGYGRK
jgi:hypothetical protein